MIRMFYDAAPAEGGGNPPAAEPLSVAAAMAKGGRKVEGGAQPATPSAPPKTPAAPPASTPPETGNQTPPASEPAKPPVKPTAEPPAPPKTEAPVEKPWQEVLKSQQPDAVLKHLGFSDKQVKMLQTIAADPKMERFYDTWASKGDMTPFVKALTTDFAKMSPEEVMKHSLRERNSEMSTEDFNELYDVKVIERYKLDPERFTEAEVKRGRIELAADVKALRADLIKQQQDYLLSAAPDQSPDNSAEQAEQAGKQVAEAYQKYMEEDAFVKGVVNTKAIKIGEGEDAFNYGVDPEKLTGVLYDSKKWANVMFKSVPDENGNGEFIPDTRRQLLVSAVASDPDGFLNAYAAHHQSIGAKKALAEIENASTPGATPSKGETTPASPAAAMAKGGRIVRGG